jgi:hypothetical protein
VLDSRGGERLVEGCVVLREDVRVVARLEREDRRLELGRPLRRAGRAVPLDGRAVEADRARETVAAGRREPGVSSAEAEADGEDDVTAIRTSYLRGAAGYFLVVDVTRAETLEVARSIQARVTSEIGAAPFLCLLNKTDLREEWEIPAQPLEELEHAGWIILRTSAKTGEGVEEAFQELANRTVL